MATGLIPPPKHVLADSSHIVSIYFDGQNKVISTDALTVGDALREAGITISQGDGVEPGRDTALPNGYYNVNVFRARPVLVIDGSFRKLVETSSQSPMLIAEAAGTTVYPEDTYTVAAINDVVGDKAVGQQLTIHRATPVVLVSDGQRQIVRTQQKTVDALLTERDVAFGPQDTVEPQRTTGITPNMEIRVNRVTVVTLKQTDPIPHSATSVKDPDLEIGTTKVVAPGVDGQKVSMFRVHYQNGIEQGRELLSAQVVRPPVTEVQHVGTKINYNADPVTLGKQLAAQRGWTGSQWDALYLLWSRESNWNPYSRNLSSGACGIPQAYPCSKITDHSVAGQITWGLSYIAGKYGTPASAWAYWQRHHSY